MNACLPAFRCAKILKFGWLRAGITEMTIRRQMEATKVLGAKNQ
jgi:hypothetical protein